MIKILAIGNSFSQDATYYLHQIAAADHVDLKVVNLNIGGCNLEHHWSNIENGAEEYRYEENGCPAEDGVSIEAVLQREQWDYIVLQQASHDSGLSETYYPYIELIADYFKRKAPKAEILLHQTWVYEIDSLHPRFEVYGYSQQTMYEKLSEAYRNAAERIGARVIPCGDVIQALRKKDPFLYGQGGMSLCRDGFHMNILYGRYLLAATWYKTIVGKSVCGNSYIPHTELAPNVVCNEQILKVVQETVDAVV